MDSGAAAFADRFAPTEGYAYLNAASKGPLPLAAVRAGREALLVQERPWRSSAGAHAGLLAEVRALAARLLGARDESVAVVTGAGQVVNTVARGLELGEGDEVLLAPHEFPANDLPWRWLTRRGVTVRVAAPGHPSGAVGAEHLAAEIGPRTRVVAFSQVSFLHGGRIDPAPVAEAARRVGAITVLDGSQAAGALPFDFGASGIDVYATSGYKFLLGPYGCGLGLFSPAVLDRIAVTDVSWQSVVGADDWDHPVGEVVPRPGAVRFDAHEPASPANLRPLAASLRLLLEVGPAVIQSHARALNDRLLASLPPGLEPASPLEPAARSHILCLRAGSPGETAAAFERLRAAKVETSLRGGRIRVAPHLYNGPGDVDRLVEALRGAPSRA